MDCSTTAHHYRSKSCRKIYRPKRGRVLGGVCAGIAEHFKFSLFWIRFAFIFGLFFQPHLVFIFYIVALFVMPTKEEWHHSTEMHHPEPSPLPPSHSTTPTTMESDSLDGLEKQFLNIESRIQILEDHVTSKEYTLLRKFNEL